MSFQRLGLMGLAFVLSLSLANYLLRTYRWHRLLKKLGERVPIWDGVLCYFSGFALTVTPGKVGEAVKAHYLKDRHNVEYHHTFAAMLTERIADLVGISFISLAALYAFKDFHFFAASVVTLIVVILGILIIEPARTNLLKPLRKARNRWVKMLSGFIDSVTSRAAALLSFRVLTESSTLALMSWSAEAFAFAYLATLVGYEGDLMLLMGIFCIGMLIGAASFIPGGLGSTEIALLFMLEKIGIPSVDAVFVVLVSRATTLWFAVALGGCAMMSLKIQDHNKSSKVTGDPSK